MARSVHPVILGFVTLCVFDLFTPPSSLIQTLIWKKSDKKPSDRNFEPIVRVVYKDASISDLGNAKKAKVAFRESNVSLYLSKTNTLPDECATNKTFLDCCHPVTALASVEGSGNTWVRHLLEEATGYYTGAVYNDSSLKKAGFKGEGKQNGEVIAVKTHFHQKQRRAEFDRVILLTRSPLDCILAEFNRRQGGGQTKHAREDRYKEAWRQFFTKRATAWRNFHRSWLSDDMPMLVVQYQDLINDLRSQLKRMVAFLGQSITEERLDCVVHNSEGKFHRKPRKKSFDPFTDDMRAEGQRMLNEMKKLKDNKLAREISMSKEKSNQTKQK